MLCRSQLVSGRQGWSAGWMQGSRSEGKTRAQANPCPLLWFCNGCTFGTAVNSSLSICYPETISSWGPLWAPHTVTQQSTLPRWHEWRLQGKAPTDCRGCSSWGEAWPEKRQKSSNLNHFRGSLQLFFTHISKGCPKWDNPLPGSPPIPLKCFSTCWDLASLMLSLPRARWAGSVLPECHAMQCFTLTGAFHSHVHKQITDGRSK